MKALRTILFPLCWRDKDVYLEIFRENKERYKAMQKKRGYDFQLFEFVLEKLMKPEPLDIKNKDHDLKGEYKGFKECHISPDWLLIYRYNGDYLELSRTGTHSDLFNM